MICVSRLVGNQGLTKSGREGNLLYYIPLIIIHVGLASLNLVRSCTRTEMVEEGREAEPIYEETFGETFMARNLNFRLRWLPPGRGLRAV